jgi:hypothetical protein
VAHEPPSQHEPSSQQQLPSLHDAPQVQSSHWQSSPQQHAAALAATAVVFTVQQALAPAASSVQQPPSSQHEPFAQQHSSPPGQVASQVQSSHAQTGPQQQPSAVAATSFAGAKRPTNAIAAARPNRVITRIIMELHVR